MREAVIVATARTPIGKAFRGGFNNPEVPTLGAAACQQSSAPVSIRPASRT